jgi:hypothetical protein
MFQQTTEDFVRESQGACAELWASSMQVFQSYRSLGRWTLLSWKKAQFSDVVNDVFEVIPFVLGDWWVFGGLGVSGNYPLLMIVFFKQGTVSINLGLAMFPSCCYLIVIACQMGGIGFKLDGVDLRSRRPPDFSAHWDAGGSAGFYRLLLLKYGISQIGMGKKLWRPWSPQIGYFDSY